MNNEAMKAAFIKFLQCSAIPCSDATSEQIFNEGYQAALSQQPAQTSNGIDDQVMISAKEMSLKMARDASAAPQLCFPDVYPGLKKLSSVAALSQQPAQPTVKESLTVQAQPSCEPVAYRWGWKDAGISGHFKTYKDKGGWIYRDELPVVADEMHLEPLYAVTPDIEALRAENAQLKENAKQFIDISLVAKWLAFTSPQVHEAFLKEFK